MRKVAVCSVAEGFVVGDAGAVTGLAITSSPR
jgi:hypothetical protein